MKKNKKKPRARKKAEENSLLSRTFFSRGSSSQGVRAVGNLAGLPVFRPLKRICLFLVLLLAGFLVVEWVTTYTREFDCFKVYADEVRCLGRPSWLGASERMTSEIVCQIQGALCAFPTRSIFDEALEKTFRENPAAFSPWIESVQKFERVFPSRFKIQLKLRRPVARFEDHGQSFFIDALGVVIAAAEHLDQGAVRSGVPLITGIGRSGPIQEGSVALNRRLIEGAAVAREIEVFAETQLSKEVRVSEIDVSGLGQGQPDDVVLITDEGVRILWGRSALNVRFKGIDPSPRKKAQKLKSVLEKKPGLLGVAEVNVAFRDAKTSYRLLENGS